MINEGKEGLESIRNEEFDLIMLDLAMPESHRTGCSQIPRTGWHNRIKEYCYLYRFVRSKGVGCRKNSGVKEVFKKPCSLDDLVKLIEKYRLRQ